MRALMIAALLAQAVLLAPVTSGAADPDQGPPPTVATLVTAGQRVSVEVLPQVVHQGRRVASPDAANAAVTATVRPVRAGRTVRLQVRRGSSWATIRTARQDREGRAEFAVPVSDGGRALVYRVRALPRGGLRVVTSPAVSTERWLTPTWTDEFSGDALGPAWTHRVQHYHPDGLRWCSKGDPGAVRVGGGVVRLSVLADPDRIEKCPTRVRDEVVGSYAYRLNGHIGTETGFSFRYGFAAARIKFHRLRGQHSAFWMQPVGGMNRASTGHEIDIIEYLGEDAPRGGLTTYVHRYEGEEIVRTGTRISHDRRFLKNRRDGWSTSYHVFSVQWTPKMLVFRIDGKEVSRIVGRISSVPQFPILSLQSSDYEIPRMKDRQLPQHMYVDWVRVWETGPGQGA